MSWFRRAHDEVSADETAARIRAAIVELTERRDEAALAASAALVGQVEVRHALRAQQHLLDQALAQAQDAVALARRVADDAARDEGELEALAFRTNVDGLEVQRDVVLAAIAQLDHLDDVSQAQVGAARQVLLRSRAEFDAALHEQLRLLVTLERFERARVLLAARADARRRQIR